MLPLKDVAKSEMVLKSMRFKTVDQQDSGPKYEIQDSGPQV